MTGRYVIVGEDGVVQNAIIWDGEADWAPPEGAEAIQSDTIGVGWTRGADGEFSAPPVPPAPPKSHEELVAMASAQRDMLFAEAGLRINPLQDAVDLGEATEEEQRSLQEWKKYRVALSRLSALEAWPNVDWPSQPAPI